MARFGKWRVTRLSKIVTILVMTLFLIFGGILDIPLIFNQKYSKTLLTEKPGENNSVGNTNQLQEFIVRHTYTSVSLNEMDIRERHNNVRNEIEKRLALESRTKQRRPLAGGFEVDQSGSHSSNFSFDIDLLTDLQSTKHEWPWGRGIQDVCDNKTYPHDLPDVSVIITFHDNERLTCILHTVHSIMRRTPPHLLKEVILVDDYSTTEELTTVLDYYVKTMFPPKVRILHSPDKVGLIQARLLGTRNATGDVIICMDSHMEVQESWLEPLLYEIKQNPKTLAASFLDWMSTDNAGQWTYQHGASKWKTYFDWTFTFGFQEIPHYQQRTRKDPTEPIETPVFVGTIFAMNRKFFEDIGAFDEQMEGWGGENLDLPLRVWLSGGRVVNVPCSHAAHYEHPGHRLYRLSWDSMIHKNYRRVAEVWLDQYKTYFYQYLPEAQLARVGNIRKRLSLREKCPRNFQWFLENIFPELGIPDRDSFAYGGLVNLASGECFDLEPPENPRMRPCQPMPRRQGVFWSTTGELRYPVHVFNTHFNQWTPGSKHLGYHLATDEYIGMYLSGMSSRWMHWKNGPLVDHRTKQCLNHDLIKGLQMVTCNETSHSQLWRFTTYTSYYYELFRDNENKLKNDALFGVSFVPMFDKFAKGKPVS